jgi:rubrerythrin
MDMHEALVTALSMEKNGYDVYMKAAQKTKNSLGKTTLEAIAKKELDHIKAIEEFSAKNMDKAISDINPKEKKEYVMPIMEKMKKALDEKTSNDADLNNAYKVAMGLEMESFNLYKKLKGGSGDAKAKQFFDFLMKEENTHYEILQDTLEYLDRPGDWYREQERWIVEG